MIKLPDYDRSILSVASSVLKHYGVADCNHKSLEELDAMLDKNYKNVIVMLFDGLGADAVNTHLDETSFLRKHFVCPISSVFPPTTVAATTSIQSGFAPIEHGWLGWDLYFKELDENVAVFRNTLQRNGEKAADYHVAGKYIPCESIFSRIEKANKSVKTFCISPFSNNPAFNFEELKDTTLSIAKLEGRKYIYVYNPQPDEYMHIFGVNSPMVRETIMQIDDIVGKICSKLKDSLVIVTADHGLIDSKMEFIEDYPNIWNMLKRPASIEPRALSLFVKDVYKGIFKEEFEKTFPNKFLVLSKDEVYEKKLFGNGNQHPRVDEFLGNFLAVGISDLTLQNYFEEETFIGVHAGLDQREMTVPLIVIER